MTPTRLEPEDIAAANVDAEDIEAANVQPDQDHVGSRCATPPYANVGLFLKLSG